MALNLCSTADLPRNLVYDSGVAVMEVMVVVDVVAAAAVVSGGGGTSRGTIQALFGSEVPSVDTIRVVSEG